MKERPILFSGPMVRAILEGRKTMTRRVVKFNRPFDSHHLWDYVYPHPGGGYIFTDGKLAHPERSIPVMAAGRMGKTCPQGKPGDRLWVRESIAKHPDGSGPLAIDGEMAVYRADGEATLKWLPSIYMPRWASRITLEVTGVRVERVQDITEGDAKGEGVDRKLIGHDYEGPVHSYRAGFARLWDSINTKRGFGWDKNPFCWVISFKRVS